MTEKNRTTENPEVANILANASRVCLDCETIFVIEDGEWKYFDDHDLILTDEPSKHSTAIASPAPKFT